MANQRLEIDTTLPRQRARAMTTMMRTRLLLSLVCVAPAFLLSNTSPPLPSFQTATNLLSQPPQLPKSARRPKTPKPPPTKTTTTKMTKKAPAKKTTKKSIPPNSTTKKKPPTLTTKTQTKMQMTLPRRAVLLLRPRRPKRELFLVVRIRLRWAILRMPRRRMGVCNGGLIEGL